LAGGRGHGTGRLAKDEALLKQLVDIVDREDVKAWREIIAKLELQRYCHQLCRWLCVVRCRLVCRLLCPPPPPLLTKAAYIPTSQIDAQGYTNLVIAHAAIFEVFREECSAADGHPRRSGWYTISEMGLAGPDYLTDWQTPAVADEPYDLRLTVRTAALTEFFSPLVPARIDNVSPTQPAIDLAVQRPDGTRTPLGCCEEIKQGEGNLLVITLQASDPNFSSISVRLLGGCGAAFSIVATDGTPLSKTYNGDKSDTGYPVPTEFLWDPWKAGVDPCCYLVYVEIWDRAIVNNSWSGAHHSANWRSITIA
jgi:hypothetical protein